MNLTRYDSEIDAILADLGFANEFAADKKEEIIDIITATILQYDKSATEELLELIVRYMLDMKFKNCYISINNIKDKIYVQNNDKNSSPKKNKTHDDDDIEIVKDSDITDKINLQSCDDLVCRVHDYEKDKFSEKKYIRRRKRVVEIKKIPQYEQKSKKWLMQRNKCLTATAIAIALDEDPYKHPIELLLDKCGKGVPFVENEYVHHGKKYEQIGNMFYAFRNNIVVDEYGLIQHSKYSFIGASPDGICNKECYDGKNISKLVGRLLEIKFPKTRKILTEGELDGDICPHQYYVQVQTQLFVTELDECDFLQCDIEEYESWEDYKADTHPTIFGLSKKTNLEKGCLIQLLPKNKIGRSDDLMCLYNAKYIYPPRLHMTNDEIEQWISATVINYPQNILSKEFMVDKIIYWRLSQVTCNLIKKNDEYFKNILPTLKQFWNYVIFYRNNPNELNKLTKFLKNTDASNTSDIFKRIHKDYMINNPDTKTEPLYQTENSWRLKFNKKKEAYKQHGNFKRNQFYNK